MIEEREKGVAQPAEQNALRVGVAQASPAEPGNAAPQVRVEELERDDDAEGGREEQRDQRGDAVRVNELRLDVGGGSACGQT